MGDFNFKERYEIGQPIFEQIFKMSDAEIKSKLKDMDFVRDIDDSMFGDKVSVTRVIKNEKPYEISIEFYDTITVNWMGVSFKPEHGPGFELIKFGKNFKL